MEGTKVNEMPRLSSQIDALNMEMQALAEAGEWEEVFEMLATRNALLLELDEGEMAAAILSAVESTDQIRELADAARQVVGEKLTGLMRGKKATDSYLSHA